MKTELTGEIPVPDRCHVCASDKIRLAEMEPDRNAWLCDDCDAFVSCHIGTTKPVGYMAGRETRKLRKRAHLSFDKLWQGRLMSRDKAYLWLSVTLKINRAEAHISWLTDNQLLTTIAKADAFFEASAETLLKRKAKNDEKKEKANDRKFAEQRRKVAERKRGKNRH